MPAKRSKKKREPGIFEGIRKPTAPPSRKFGKERPEERVHPSGRKVKHKEKIEKNDGDL